MRSPDTLLASGSLKEVNKSRIEEDLGLRGWTYISGLMARSDCQYVRGLYKEDLFRSQIDMHRYGFGCGEYKYLSYPLPPAIEQLRTALYELLVSGANQWRLALGQATFPPTHEEFLRDCHEAGQCRPTPLILRYCTGDYNRLHQDLYGDLVFPIQVAVLLSEPGREFEGGEFVLTEQQPRAQSKVEVIPLRQGDAVVFAVNERPVPGKNGYYRVRMRHGVSRILSGERFTLGIILHDAK